MRVTERREERILFCRARDRCCSREPCYRVYCGVRRKRERKRRSGKRRSAEKDKRNSTYLAYFSAYVLPELVETSRQGHLVTASHSILARQFVHRVPDVIALEQISNSIILSLFFFLSFILYYIVQCEYQKDDKLEGLTIFQINLSVYIALIS